VPRNQTNSLRHRLRAETHHRLGGLSGNAFHAAVLRSLGVTPQRDRQVIQVLWDALDATTRFGTADWQARLTATDQYFKLRGAYAKAQLPASERTQRHTVDVAPWLKRIMESRAENSNARAIPAATNNGHLAGPNPPVVAAGDVSRPEARTIPRARVSVTVARAHADAGLSGAAGDSAGDTGSRLAMPHTVNSISN
jgi:hypothetical protein